MPTSITLKNVPDDLYDCLKRSADFNQRSINGEAIACLARALTPTGGATPERLARARQIRERLDPARFAKLDVRSAIRRGRP